MDDKNLGLIIDEIRRNRNFTIEALCDEIISPSTYSRFVSGKTYLASDSFMKLVFRLHMTFAMFLQDYLDFFSVKHHYAILNHAKGYNDIPLVKALIDSYQTRKREQPDGWLKSDEKFLRVAIALLSQLEKSPERQLHLENVQTYMAKLKCLTDNDFFALKLLLPYMKVTDAELVIKKTMKQLTDLKEPGLSENLYYVCGVMYIKNLQLDKQKRALHYYNILDSIYLDHLDLGWKLSQKLFQNIHLYFNGDAEKATDQLNKLSLFYFDLNLPHQSRFIAETCRDLAIPHQEVEVML